MMLAFLKSKLTPADESARFNLESWIHVVHSELIEGSYVWHDCDSGEFIAQGQTDEEIRSVLKSRWVNHIFVIGHQHMIMGPDFDQLIEFNRNTNEEPV
jgi:hypothetical protein